MRYFIIINYGDRAHCSSRGVAEMKDLLGRAGVEYSLELSRSTEHSRELMEEAGSKDYDVLVVGGGDGTVNTLINIGLNKGLSFGVLPLGTVNALARSLGMPRSPLKSLELIIKGQPQPIDYGTVNDRAFVGFASVGFDAAVTHKTRLGPKFRTISHILTGLSFLSRWQELPELKISIPNKGEFTAYNFIVTNIPIYGGLKIFNSVPDSGKMQLSIFKSRHPIDIVRYLFGYLPHKDKYKSPFKDVVCLDVEEFEVRSSKPMFLQVDGEPVKLGDDCHYQFKVHKGGINFILQGE